MNLPSKISSRLWLVILICAGGFLIWINHARIQRVEYVSGLAGGAGMTDASSPTGYAQRQRKLIVPERNERSFEWIAQTQQMFASGEWRVRSVEYENAPPGREVNAGSPYRWWLGLLARLDQRIFGRPIGLAVEQAALWADPVLHGLLLIAGTLFVAWRFGGVAAGLFSIGVMTLFPLAAGFLPGVPDHHGFARACAMGSGLLFLAGIRDDRPGIRWFVAAGIVGGFGLWLDVPTQLAILTGIFMGGLMAVWTMRRNAAAVAGYNWSPRLCRIWSISGAITVVAGYLVEFYPGHLGSWHLESIHPLYGLAWLGAGELLARAAGWKKGGKISWGFRDVCGVLLAAIAIAAVPVAMSWSGSRGYLERDLLSIRLTSQPDGVVAANFWSWVTRDGMTATVCATLTPLLIVVPAGWLMISRASKPEFRATLAFALGPVLVAVAIASQQLLWWGLLDVTLLVLLVAATSSHSTSSPKRISGLWLALVTAIALAGGGQVWPRTAINSSMTLTASEAEELIERHLAHWLAGHADEPGAIVYAPPHETTTLSFYGGLRGIGTFATENRAGFGASLMIAGVKTMEEVQGLLQARGIRYIVIPSWDPFFEEFGHLYLASSLSNRKSFFIGELRRWNLPLWLKPVAYPMPQISGFEKQSVLVFEVVDEQTPVVAASRLAEYLVEIGELDQAASSAETLRRFPGDIGALAARAQVQTARGDAAGAAQTVDVLLSRLSAGADRFLPWDRRVSLAVVLARSDRIDRAREQTRRCIAELNESKLRSLSTGSLYTLTVLTHSFGIAIADPKLHALASELLPAELRDNL